jgi:hypothetical protein
MASAASGEAAGVIEKGIVNQAAKKAEGGE